MVLPLLRVGRPVQHRSPLSGAPDHSIYPGAGWALVRDLNQFGASALVYILPGPGLEQPGERKQDGSGSPPQRGEAVATAPAGSVCVFGACVRARNGTLPVTPRWAAGPGSVRSR